MFDYLALQSLKFVLDFQQNYYALGLLSGFLLLSFNAPDDSKSKPVLAVFGLLSVIPFAASFLINPLANQVNLDVQPSKVALGFWFGCVVISYVVAAFWLRVGVQKMEVVKKKLTRSSSLERNKKTDVREIEKFLPADKKRFDPLTKINIEKKGFFVGMNEHDKPIYIRRGDWETSHILLTGRTRSGKGVAAQIIGAQSIIDGELFVVLDPKVDNWMPHIYKKICEEHGKPYHFLDLRQSAYPQINLFENCTEEVLENMLIGAFSLTEKGDNADFYRLGDRKAARQAARFIASRPGTTPRDVINMFAEEWEETASGFLAALGEMADLPSVNRKEPGGIDIEELAASGGCLFVVGDMQNTRIVRMQRMILLRLMMLAKNRDQLKEQRIIRVLADEFRVHISRPFIVGLGAAAGWRLLTILAFQSFEDLRDCPADLDADMVKGAAVENCALQLSYRIKDPKTAEILAAATGQILVDDESRNVEKNLALTETIGQRNIRQTERFFVDVNMITNLPVPDPTKKTIGCGVLVGAGKLAQFCFTSPVQVERSQSAITPTVPEPSDWKKSARGIGEMSGIVIAPVAAVPSSESAKATPAPAATPAEPVKMNIVEDEPEAVEAPAPAVPAFDLKPLSASAYSPPADEDMP